jgi:hypothetical protein
VSTVPAEIAHLVDLAPVQRTEAALAEHQQRLATARTLAARSSDAVLVARAAMEALIDRAFGGEEVTSADVAAAHSEARDAESYSAFTAALARRYEAPVAAAQAALADALHEAWLPVLRHGQDLRIAAAARADRARLLQKWNQDTPPDQIPKLEAARAAAFEAAAPEFARGTAVLELACDRGVRLDLRLRVEKPTWPSSEDRERRHWNRPLTPEDLTDAA